MCITPPLNIIQNYNEEIKSNISSGGLQSTFLTLTLQGSMIKTLTANVAKAEITIQERLLKGKQIEFRYQNRFNDRLT